MTIKLGIDTHSGDRVDKGGNPIDISQVWTEAVLNQLEEKPDLEVVLAGDQDELITCVHGLDGNLLEDRIRYINTKTYYDMHGTILDEDGSPGKRNEASYNLILDALKENQIHGVVAGNNTRIMIQQAASKIKRLPFFRSFPPLTIEIPNEKNSTSLFLDIGTTSDYSIETVENFAKLAITYAKEIMDIPNPRLGLISNGTEKSKGTKDCKEASKLLYEKFQDNYIGYIEPSFRGPDIILAHDGFTGNIMLKMMESSLKFSGNKLKENITDPNPPFFERARRKLGYLLLKNAFDEYKSLMDPSNYNGTPFLGLNKPIFKSHGGSNIKAIESAISNSYDFLKSKKFERFNEALRKEYERS